jgi:hypothetical protein
MWYTYFVVILYIFPRFGMLYQEKTGNPGAVQGLSSKLWLPGTIFLQILQKILAQGHRHMQGIRTHSMTHLLSSPGPAEAVAALLQDAGGSGDEADLHGHGFRQGPPGVD